MCGDSEVSGECEAKTERYSYRYRQYRYSPCIVYRVCKLNIVSCIGKCHQLTLADHNQNKRKNWKKLGKPGMPCFLFFFILTSQRVLSWTRFLTKCDARCVFLYRVSTCVSWYSWRIDSINSSRNLEHRPSLCEARGEHEVCGESTVCGEHQGAECEAIGERKAMVRAKLVVRVECVLRTKCVMRDTDRQTHSTFFPSSYPKNTSVLLSNGDVTLTGPLKI